MNFELLISTMHKNTTEILQMLEKSNVKCNALVVVQGEVEGYEEVNQDSQRIRILFSKDRGLSKSRNLALNNCISEYGYIMDDDVQIENKAIENLVSAMAIDNIDIATVKFTQQNGKPPKEYSKKPFMHNILSTAKVSSIEICIKINSLKDNNIWFDENFGLGTNLPSGEEYIFLTDCLKSGLKVKYYPIIIGLHPDTSSGQDFYSSASKIFAKRKMLKRIFGWKSSIYILAFWAKKLPEVIKAGYGFKFTKIMLLGLK